MMLLLTLGLLGCASRPPVVPTPPVVDPQPALILISIDGLRHDASAAVPTPTLDWLAAGVHADGLQPPFPSFTFPSHYTLATGLHPDQHGIVSNLFYDPERGDMFKLGDQADMTDARWWGGEPIWNTAERQGVLAATMFWPGSEAPINGKIASTMVPYDGGMPNPERVDRVLSWLDRSPAERPGLITLYFGSVDKAGHRSGPGSAAVGEALIEVDAALGRLLEGIEARGLTDHVDIVVVSDHGMGARTYEQAITVDDSVLDGLRVVERSPLMQIHGVGGGATDLAATLDQHDHLSCFTRATTPEAWHYRNHPAIGDVVCLADNGWQVNTGLLERHLVAGSHGWDPSWADMHGVFMARGPRIATGVQLPTLPGVEVYGALCAIAGITPHPDAAASPWATQILSTE